jgi:hypothetical protein
MIFPTQLKSRSGPPRVRAACRDREKDSSDTEMLRIFVEEMLVSADRLCRSPAADGTSGVQHAADLPHLGLIDHSLPGLVVTRSAAACWPTKRLRGCPC